MTKKRKKSIIGWVEEETLDFGFKGGSLPSFWCSEHKPIKFSGIDLSKGKCKVRITVEEV